MKDETCKYIRRAVDAHGTNWKTSCGREVRCEVPEEVGICFAPLPNESGDFCHFCGKKIETNQK